LQHFALSVRSLTLDMRGHVSQRFFARTSALVVAGSLAAGTLALAGGPAVAAAARSKGWRIVSTVGAANHNELPGLFAATGRNTAFSSWRCVACSTSNRAQDFIRRWNGRTWHPKIALPVPLNYPRSIISLSASSASNLWAFTSNGRAGTWNGHGWKVRSLPAWVLRPGRVGEPFAQAAIFGPGNVWVFCIGAIKQPVLAGHFSNGRWRQVSLPGAPEEVSALAPDDIWVLGITKQSLTAAKPVFAAMHWNGSSWRVLKLPAAKIPQGDSVGYRIAAVGPRNIWLARLVGTATHTSSVAVLHWTGRWRVTKAPTPIDNVGPLAQDGHGGLWMDAQHGTLQTARDFLYHFGGGRWTHRAVPAPAGAHATLSSLTWIPGTRSLWAAATAIAVGKQTGEILKFGP
jgi:hypothetical protein